jgi:hypothetical protein
MQDRGDATRDHPYLPHYGWSSIPGGHERYELTPEKQARNEQHAADKEAVEGGRTLRLVLAAPVVIWSFAGIPALVLLAVATLLGVFSGSEFDTGPIDAGLIGFFVLLVVIEVASIWEATMLVRDQLSVPRWRAVLILTVVVAVAVTATWVVWAPVARAWLLVVLVAWYCVGMALWQWRRSVRPASAVERLDKYSP